MPASCAAQGGDIPPEIAVTATRSLRSGSAAVESFAGIVKAIRHRIKTIMRFAMAPSRSRPRFERQIPLGHDAVKKFVAWLRGPTPRSAPTLHAGYCEV